MNNIIRGILASLLLLTLISGFIQGEETRKVTKFRVFINHSGEDTIGMKLAIALKEKLMTSKIYELTYNIKDAMAMIEIISEPNIVDGKMLSSAIAVVAVYNPRYLRYYLDGYVDVFFNNTNFEQKAKYTITWMNKFMLDTEKLTFLKRILSRI